ncbi:HGGxSTG domain-containing protein [Acidovorax sp. BoFeN1]|jgi:hypothetical protein|uniref:HGGxSTG domain-containing protein n=1 Tax=Acidovorax sp. BoFeN1 TaxID=1231053 RepID=UPI00268B9AD6
MTDAERRQLWRSYVDAYFRAQGAWEAAGRPMPRPPMPTQPEAVQGLQCGATTRAGTPCKLTGLYKSGRCKLHGGMSTGPKTDAGREQSRINGAKGGRPRNPTP